MTSATDSAGERQVSTSSTTHELTSCDTRHVPPTSHHLPPQPPPRTCLHDLMIFIGFNMSTLLARLRTAPSTSLRLPSPPALQPPARTQQALPSCERHMLNLQARGGGRAGSTPRQTLPQGSWRQGRGCSQLGACDSPAGAAVSRVGGGAGAAEDSARRSTFKVTLWAFKVPAAAGGGDASSNA